MSRLGQEMYDALAGGAASESEDWDFVTRLDAAVVTSVARKHLFRRDVYWGGALAVVTLTGLGMLAWYTPTKTVTVTEIEVRDAPDAACNDALDKAGELFNIISQVMIKSGERDIADDSAVTALRDKNWDEFQSAATNAFAINDQMIVLVDQAKGVDLGSAEACRG